jgi:TPR repeat protein
VPPDYARAAAYFQQAAAQGVAFSHFFLGMIFAGGGPGVKADPIQAYKWLSTGSTLHQLPRYRDDALSSRALVAQGMTKAQIAVAERLAFDWKEKFQQRRAKEQ